MVRHKLPQGFNERIREREEAKRQKLARTADTPLSTPAKLKTSMTTAKQGHKRLKQEQAKTEQQAGELLLENLDKAQLLALLQTQMQGGGAPDGSPRVSQETEEDEEEEDGNEEEDAHYDLFNTIFSAIEETREKTTAMQNMFDGMNCMAATLLASTKGQEKETVVEPSLLQAQKQRMRIGENILEKFGREQKQSEDKVRAKQVLNVLTDSLAPLITAKQAAAQKSQTTSKDCQSSAAGQSSDTSVVAKKKSTSERRKKLQEYITRYKK